MSLFSSKIKDSEMAIISRAGFNRIYAALAPCLYGIVLRFAEDEHLAQEILIDIFICLNNQGKLTPPAAANPASILPTVFQRTARGLAMLMPDNEVQDRLFAEKARIRAAIADHKQHAAALAGQAEMF